MKKCKQPTNGTEVALEIPPKGYSCVKFYETNMVTVAQMKKKEVRATNLYYSKPILNALPQRGEFLFYGICPR